MQCFKLPVNMCTGIMVSAKIVMGVVINVAVLLQKTPLIKFLRNDIWDCSVDHCRLFIFNSKCFVTISFT